MVSDHAPDFRSESGLPARVDAGAADGNPIRENIAVTGFPRRSRTDDVGMRGRYANLAD